MKLNVREEVWAPLAGKAEGVACERNVAMASLARQAATLCGSAIGLVSILDADAQHIVGSVGIDVQRVPITEVVCAYTILQPEVFVVEDALADPRFSDLPIVLGAPFVRFYAGAPFFDDLDRPLGTVCVIDPHPHPVAAHVPAALQRLAALAAASMQLRALALRPPGGLATPSQETARRHRFDALLQRVIEAGLPPA